MSTINPKSNKIVKLKSTPMWLKILAILWVLWVFIDFWFKHPLYASAFSHTFAAIPMAHLIVGVVGYYALTFQSKRWLSMLVVLGLFFAFLWSGTLVNLTMYSSVEYSASSIFWYMVRTVLFIGLLAFVVFSSYQAGRWLLNRLFLSKLDLAISVYIAAGLSLHLIFIFLLLLFGLFHTWILAALFALPLILNFKSIVPDLTSLVQPIKNSSIGVVGLASILLIMLLDAITFGYTLSPFPIGFDALNYYVNLPKLMAEAGHLLKGYQPYNWSLLQAAGVGIAGRIEPALMFSWLGILLVQGATFEVGRRIMKLPVDLSLLGVVLFSFMPSVMTQASQELKVDLGLTFMILAMLLAGFSLIKHLRSTDGLDKTVVALAMLVGGLCGVALGIKLTAVIAMLAIVAVLWYDRLGRLAFIGVFLICLGVVFLAQLDSKAGLRFYHASVIWLQFVALVVGLGLLVYASRLRWEVAFKTLIVSLIIGISSVTFFMPWVAKNYFDADKPTFMELINGTSQGPEFSIRTIDRNLRKKQKQEKKIND